MINPTVLSVSVMKSALCNQVSFNPALPLNVREGTVLLGCKAFGGNSLVDLKGGAWLDLPLYRKDDIWGIGTNGTLIDSNGIILSMVSLCLEKFG